MKAIDVLTDERDRIERDIERLTKEQEQYTTEYPRAQVQKMIDWDRAQLEMLNWILNYEA